MGLADLGTARAKVNVRPGGILLQQGDPPLQTLGSEGLVAVTGSSASMVTPTTQILMPCYFHRRFANLISSPLHQSAAPAQ